MACVVAGLIAIPVTAGIGYFLARLSGSLGAQMVGIVMPAIILVGLVSAFFRIAIRRPRLPQRRVVPGACVTVLLWGLCSALFSLYVAELAQYATLYGNLATVAILMLWLWLLSMALIVGGEVNAELERLRDATPKSSGADRTSGAGHTKSANPQATGEGASASKSGHATSAPPAP
jgi:membrane protein